MSQRRSGLDLLRCMALLFVVTFHSFLNNGYYSQPQTGFTMLLAGSFRWLSVSCIGLFLMLTGYLKSKNTDFKSCYRGLPGVLLGYLLAAAISVPIRHFVFGDTQPLGIWLTRLFSFSAVYYGWYVEMYIGLILLSPFVNILLKCLQDTRKLLMLAAVLLTLTALSGASPLPILPDFWRGMYPLTYYILGAIVYRLQPKLHPLVGIAGAAAIALLLGTATVLSTEGTLSEALTWEFADFWIILMVLALFIGFYHVQPPVFVQRLLAFGAKGCYGGYLLSHLLDAWCYKLMPRWNTPDQYGKVFFLITLPIFLLSVCGGWLLERLVYIRKEGRL